MSTVNVFATTHAEIVDSFYTWLYSTNYEPWEMSLISKAFTYAAVQHATQKRKYSGDPYIVHPFEVMLKVAEVDDRHYMLCAALLHDTIEDTDATYEDIAEMFGPGIAEMVDGLTDKSTKDMGNRAVRKAFDRDRLAGMSDDVKTIKCADLISNTKSIVKDDPNFAKIYLVEKLDLLAVLVGANQRLYVEAQALALRGIKDLGIEE